MYVLRAWPPQGCEEWKEVRHWIRVVGSEIEIVQMVGGTRGTDYVYVEDSGFLTNVRYLLGARLVAREEWGRGRRREMYRVPKSILVNRLVVRVSFSNSGYMHLTLCRVREDGVECYWCSSHQDLCRELATRFGFVGGERQLAEFYINFVPRLVDEIKRIARKANTEGVFFAGHAKRFEETFVDPYLSLFTSMVLDTWQGRVLSLQEKISHIAELWVLAKIIEAMDGETMSLRYDLNRVELVLGGEWWIEFTKNRPFAYIRSRTKGKEYTFFYQPSIYPHIISAFLPGKKRLHLVPDIVIFEGIIDQLLDWGELHKLIEQGKHPLLVVEVKTGLETSEWRSPEYILGQLKTYKEYLQPKRIALAVLMPLRDTLFRAALRSLNVDVFDNLLNPKAQEAFRNYILETLV